MASDSAGCSTNGCAEPGAASLEQRPFCQSHFLLESYRFLEEASTRMRAPEFHQSQSESAGRLLEEIMRSAVEIAFRPSSLDNLQKAQLLDVLLWASELHSRLRRSPRMPIRIAILLHSEAPERPWEEKTETDVLSRHGFQVTCRHEAEAGDLLTCTRLDNGARAKVRVAWLRRQHADQTEMGLAFVSEEDFWNRGVSLLP